MAGTRSGEVMYYHLDFPNSVPIRRPPPTDLPDLEADSWWSTNPSFLKKKGLIFSNTSNVLAGRPTSTCLLQPPRSSF